MTAGIVLLALGIFLLVWAFQLRGEDVDAVNVKFDDALHDLIWSEKEEPEHHAFAVSYRTTPLPPSPFLDVIREIVPDEAATALKSLFELSGTRFSEAA